MFDNRKCDNSQLKLLPATLPDTGRGASDLMVAVVDDLRFTPNERVKTIGALVDRVEKERPKLINSFFYSRVCHLVTSLSMQPNSDIAVEFRPLLVRLSPSVQKVMSDSLPQSIANTAWAFARLGIHDRELFGTLSARTNRMISKFKPQDIANTAWAFATLGIPDRTLFDNLSAQTKNTISEFNSQDIAYTAWAFATIGIRDETLFRALSTRAKNITSEFTSQDLATTALAFATLGIRDESLFSAFSTRAKNIISEFTSQHLSNTARAFASLGIADEKLFDTLSAHAKNTISYFTSEDIALTAWAFATFGIQDKTLFDTLGDRAKDIISKFTSQDLVKTASAFATLDIRHKKFFKKLTSQVEEHILVFTSQDIAKTATAFATLGIRDESLFSAFSTRAKNIISEFASQDIASTAWAFGVLEPQLVETIVPRDILENQKLSAEQFLQCYQALLAAGLVSPQDKLTRYEDIISRYDASLPPNSFQQLIRDATTEALSDKVHTLRHNTVFAGVAVDWELTVGGRHIIIACDVTKDHRTIGPNRDTLFGRDIILGRILQRFGYEMLHITDKEWSKHRDDRVNFMRARIFPTALAQGDR